jgi:hypothetical protein
VWFPPLMPGYLTEVPSKRSPRPSRKPKSAKKKPPTKAKSVQRSKRRATRSPAAARLAAQMAAKMPFTHFPARTRFETFVRWEWLRSWSDMNEPQPRGDFEQLRWSHVFAYAGPSCYYSNRSAGDAVIYFQPSLDSGQPGAVSPFD